MAGWLVVVVGVAVVVVLVVVVVVVMFSGPHSADSIGELQQKGVENVNFRPLKARFYMGLAPEGRIL